MHPTDRSGVIRRRTKQRDKLAAIVPMLAGFGFFEYYIWSRFYQRPHGLFILVCVELVIGGLGAAWGFWGLRNDRRRR